MGKLGAMDRIRPYHAWPLGMGVLVAALPGITVAIVVAAVALLAVGAVIFVATRRRHAPDPPLENEVLGEWFEHETAGVEANGASVETAEEEVAPAVETNGFPVQADGKDPAPAVAASVASAATVGTIAAAPAPSALSPVVSSAMRPEMATEVATEVADGADVPTSAYAPPAVDDAVDGTPDGDATTATGAVAWSNGWPDAAPVAAAAAATGSHDETADEGPDAPFAGDEFDYGSLERDLGFTERTGGALAVGIASVVLVVLLGLWLVAATHHGAGTPIQIVHTPIPGPLGPQGSPAP